MERVLLSAYQRLEVLSADLGEQFTEGGDKPRTLHAVLTTAMDDKFVNRSVTWLLTEDDQRKVIDAFTRNLQGEDL